MQEYMSHMKMRMSERKSVQGRCSRQVSVAAVPAESSMAVPASSSCFALSASAGRFRFVHNVQMGVWNSKPGRGRWCASSVVSGETRPKDVWKETYLGKARGAGPQHACCTKWRAEERGRSKAGRAKRNGRSERRVAEAKRKEERKSARTFSWSSGRCQLRRPWRC